MPQTRRRSPESQDQFRRQLLDYARKLYREQGYEALSIRAITEAFDMSPMSFYGYFPSKLDLVREIWIDFFRELLERLLAAGKGMRSPQRVVEAHVEAYFSYWEEHADRYRMVYLSDLGAPGGVTIKFDDEPVTMQIRTLTRERVLACAHGRPVTEKKLRFAMDLFYVKMIGYLHATLAVERYKIDDVPRVRRLVVRDIVDTLCKLTGEAAAR